MTRPDLYRWITVPCFLGAPESQGTEHWVDVFAAELPGYGLDISRVVVRGTTEALTHDVQPWREEDDSVFADADDAADKIRVALDEQYRREVEAESDAEWAWRDAG